MAAPRDPSGALRRCAAEVAAGLAAQGFFCPDCGGLRASVWSGDGGAGARLEGSFQTQRDGLRWMLDEEASRLHAALSAEERAVGGYSGLFARERTAFECAFSDAVADALARDWILRPRNMRRQMYMLEPCVHDELLPEMYWDRSEGQFRLSSDGAVFVARA